MNDLIEHYERRRKRLREYVKHAHKMGTRAPANSVQETVWWFLADVYRKAIYTTQDKIDLAYNNRVRTHA